MAVVVENEILSRNRFHLTVALPLLHRPSPSQEPDADAKASESEAKEETNQKTYNGA